MKKLPFAGLALLGTAALAFCAWRFSPQPAAEASQITAAPVAAKSAQSALPKITARGVKLDATAEMLGMNMWRFDVQLPKVERDFEVVLQLREKGKATQRLCSESQFRGLPRPTSGQVTVFIGTYPLTGVLRDSEKAKYVVRVEGYEAKKGETLGSRGGTNLAANAFNGLLETSSDGIPLQGKDGSFVLMSGDRKSKPQAKRMSPPDVELVFVVRPLS